jgi:hypothetical protein
MTNKRGDGPAHPVDGPLLGDILNANLDQRGELEALRDWVRRVRSNEVNDPPIHLDD